MSQTCLQCRIDFTITSEDQNFYTKFQVPVPKTCPRCRFIRRLLERNSRTLYYRRCDFSGKEIISMFPDKTPFPVYAESVWFSDQWDAEKYAQEIDWQQPFFPQFKKLKYQVPHFATFIAPNSLENSDYTNCTGYLKNCYLICESDYDEDCYYGNLLKKSKNLVDCSVCYESELCYECIDCVGCYNLIYSQDCQSCQDSAFLQNCQSCRDCIGCINQRQKQYMIFNQQYTREEYQRMKESLLSKTLIGLRELEQKARDFFQAQPHKFRTGENLENSTGDHIYNTKNAWACFDSKDLEDCRYCQKVSLGVKSSMDYTSWGDKAELVYQSAACGDAAYNLKFCTTCTTNNVDLEYCDQCTGCRDCFGCVGLKKKQYCIFNKQYAKEDYFATKAKLIAHMRNTGEYGEFFPADICVFGYNETVAMDYFPLTKEDALQQEYKWKEADPKEYRSQTCTVPVHIPDVPDNITQELLACRQCGRNYKIIQQELRFYRTMQLPIPDHCPTCRHIARMQKRNPAQLWERKCTQCSEPIQTTYAPERKEKVYCGQCYLKEVY